MSWKKTNYETKKEVNSLWIGTAINEKQSKVLSDNVIEALNEDGGDGVKTIEDALLYINEKVETGGGGRAYAITDTDNVILERADANADLLGDKAITKTISQDGYLYVNCNSAKLAEPSDFYVTVESETQSGGLIKQVSDLEKNVATKIGEAPKDSKDYVRNNGNWVERKVYSKEEADETFAPLSVETRLSSVETKLSGGAVTIRYGESDLNYVPAGAYWVITNAKVGDVYEPRTYAASTCLCGVFDVEAGDVIWQG